MENYIGQRKTWAEKNFMQEHKILVKLLMENLGINQEWGNGCHDIGGSLQQL